jgi:serine/threonine protein kinase
VRELHPGDVLAGYRIDAVAGRGGMGVVYRATHLRLERADGLKVIAPELADEPEFRSRFEREWRVAAQIDHPNVIPIYSAGEENGLLYIAMRFVEGTDVRAVLVREGRIEPRRAARIVDAVAAALDAAHERGLVHRDVKPANVLLARQREREHVYLTDFGLTKMLSSAQGETKTGMFVGTIDYVSPEQVLGGPLDARSDIYSLGCMLFHMLTGRVPYPVDFEAAKLVAHTRDPVPSVLSVAPDLPSQFDAVVRRAMAKHPDQRYLSAGDLGRAALAAAEGRTVTRAQTSVARGAAAPAAVSSAYATPTTESATVLDASPQPGTDGQPSERPVQPLAAADPTEQAAAPPAAAPPAAPTSLPPAATSEPPAGAPPAPTESAPTARHSTPRWLPAAVAGAVIAVIAVVLVIALGGSSSHRTAPPVTSPVSAPQANTSTTTTAGTASISQGAGSRGLAPASPLTTQNTTGAINLGQTATFALTDKGAGGPLVSVRAVSVNNNPVDQDSFLQQSQAPAGSKLVAVVFEVQSAVAADDVTTFLTFGGSDSSAGNANPDTIVAGPDCVFHNQTAGGPPLTAGQLLKFCLLYAVSPGGHLAQVTASPFGTPQNLGIATATWNLP